VERGAGVVFENRGGDALLAARCPNNNAAQQSAPALAHCIGCMQRT
jgi:hypothetical protein